MLPLRLALLILSLSSTLVLAADDLRYERDYERFAARANREAGDILSDILQRRGEAPAPCVFADRWNRISPVSPDLARKYLGLTLYADLTAPYPGTVPAQILDPAGTMKQNFCSQADAEKLRDRRVADFKNGILGDEKDRNTNSPMIHARRIDFAMPVFDASFSTAVVMGVYTGQIWMKRDSEAARAYPERYDAAGFSLFGRPYMSAYSYVYRKRNGRWTLIEEREDSVAD